MSIAHFIRASALLVAAFYGLPDVRAESTAPLRSETVQDGVHRDVYEAPSGREVWIYRPEPRPEGKRPLVLIPPGGGSLYTAPRLGAGDVPEHVPWVQAGFTVVSFALGGAVDDRGGPNKVVDAAKAYRAARAGVDDARAALTLALERTPDVDGDAIFAAGHSSAGSLVLLLGLEDDRIRGIVAFAPRLDAAAAIGDELAEGLEDLDPGYAAFLSWSSPIRHLHDFKRPMLLFHAADDITASFNAGRDFADRLREAGAPVEFVGVRAGGHYESMIDEGIPAAIRWTETLRGPDEHRRVP